VSGVTVRLMSDGELTRLEALRDLDQKRWLLELGRRQVFRGLKAYRTEGPSGLISKRRGRRSNRRKSEALRRAAVAIIRQWYRDFGPTVAVEKLREDMGLPLGRETVRQWMIEAGLWLDRRQRRNRIHQPRRECVGELFQVDGCEHWWFEDRGVGRPCRVVFDAAGIPALTIVGSLAMLFYLLSAWSPRLRPASVVIVASPRTGAATRSQRLRTPATRPR
jgi:hypothetical protein